MGNNIHKKVKEYEKTWEERCYKNGIPDESPAEILDKVPSYKKIALAILSNDLHLKSLGFEGKKSKFYSAYKRIELTERYKNDLPKQLKLKL